MASTPLAVDTVLFIAEAHCRSRDCLLDPQSPIGEHPSVWPTASLGGALVLHQPEARAVPFQRIEDRHVRRVEVTLVEGHNLQIVHGVLIHGIDHSGRAAGARVVHRRAQVAGCTHE